MRSDMAGLRWIAWRSCDRVAAPAALRRRRRSCHRQRSPRRCSPQRLRIIGTNDFHGGTRAAAGHRRRVRGGARQHGGRRSGRPSASAATRMRDDPARRRRHVPGHAGLQLRVRPLRRRHLQLPRLLARPRSEITSSTGGRTRSARACGRRITRSSRAERPRSRPRARRAVDPERHDHSARAFQRSASSA